MFYSKLLLIMPGSIMPLDLLPSYGSGIRTVVIIARKPRDDHWAIRYLNFTLRPEEKITLVGKNGAGKITLVKLLDRSRQS